MRHRHRAAGLALASLLTACLGGIGNPATPCEHDDTYPLSDTTSVRMNLDSSVSDEEIALGTTLALRTTGADAWQKELDIQSYADGLRSKRGLAFDYRARNFGATRLEAGLLDRSGFRLAEGAETFDSGCGQAITIRAVKPGTVLPDLGRTD